MPSVLPDKMTSAVCRAFPALAGAMLIVLGSLSAVRAQSAPDSGAPAPVSAAKTGAADSAVTAPDSTALTRDSASAPAASAPVSPASPGTDSVSPVPAVAAPIEAPTVEAPSVEAPSIESPAAPTVAGGPDDITIEVDPAQSRNRGKSLPLAMLLSATLPGAGEYYLQEKGIAKAFLLTEAGFWAALYIGFVARDSYLQSARNYASEYAGIDASRKSTAFLDSMAKYRSYQEKQHRQDSYELAQILAGKRDRNYDIAPTEANDWDFGSSANPENTGHWRTFQSTLRYYRGSKVAISFAVGFLALNRLASLANTLNVYRRTSAHGMGLQIHPEIGPDYTGGRLSLRF